MANFNDTLNKTIGEINSEVSYNFKKLSTQQTDIITAVINQDFYTDAKTAYEPSSSNGFKTSYQQSTSSSLVKQADNTGKITCIGELCRYVPGDYTQTLFIKTITGLFSPDNGVILNNGRGIDGVSVNNGQMNVFSYGSSIKSVRMLTSVFKITAYFSTETSTDYGSFILGNRVIVGNTLGTVLSVILGSGNISIIVEVDSAIGVVVGGNIQELQNPPCAKYVIDKAESLVQNNILQEIVFNDTKSFSYIPTFPGQASFKVLQYNYNSSNIISGQEYLSKTEGNVLGWNAPERKLYVQCLTGIFIKECGKIYQLDADGVISTNGLGGSAYDLEKSNFNKTSGFFINISEKHDPTKNYTIGTTIAQQISQSVSWDPLQNYAIGSTVRQFYDGGTEWAEGTVLKWYNPKTFAQSLLSPPKLILLKTSENKFNFSPASNKILPSNIPFSKSSTWNYSIGPSFVQTTLDGSNFNIDQVVPSEIEFKNKVQTLGNEAYTSGSVIEEGTLLAKCFIRSISEPSDSIYVGRNVKKISISNLIPQSDFTSDDVLTYFGNIEIKDDTGAVLSIFERDETTVEYLKMGIFPTDQIKENDTIQSADGASSTVLTIEPYSQAITYLTLKRKITDKVFDLIDATETNPNGIISTCVRNGINITLSGDSIKVLELKPLASIYYTNRSENGLIYPLQGTNYFEKVLTASAAPPDIYVTKSYLGSYSAGNITIAGSVFELATFDSGKFTYITAGDIIKSIDISGLNQNATTKLISFSTPSDMKTNSKYLLNANLKISPEVNYRKKNLEPATSSRTLLYDSDIEEYYAYLPKSDVYSITNISITDLSPANIADYFSLDSGETDDIYGFSKILLNKDYVNKIFNTTSGYTQTNLPLLNIQYNYFLHESATTDKSGPIARESYRYGDNSIMSLDDIGFFASKLGKIYHKSSFIDFRPILVCNNEANLTSAQSPYDVANTIQHTLTPNKQFLINTTHYLSRVDKLYINKAGNFTVDSGVSSLEPLEPATNSNLGMLLYTIDIPGYTGSLSDISYRAIENRRYTMRDIGKLDKRISQLEYYTTLSLLEKEATDLIVKDANGLTREKNGIVTDSFIGHSVGDVFKREYNSCVNPNEGYLRHPFKTSRFDLVVKPSGDTNDFYSEPSNTLLGAWTTAPTTIGTGIWILKYTKTERLVQQVMATQTILITALDSAQYLGNLSVYPAVDDWVDTNWKPALVVNLNGNNDAIEQMQQALFNNNIAPFGTFDSDWTTTSRTVVGQGTLSANGRHASNEVHRGNRAYQRMDVYTSQERVETTGKLVGTDRTVDLGDRVVDVSISHYIRPQPIILNVQGMRPNTRFYVFFDGINIENYCKILTFTGQSTWTSSAMVGGTEFPRTDKDGNIVVEFSIPENTFRTGDKLIVVTDSQTNNKYSINTTMYAESVFSATGLTLTKESTTTTVRDFKFQETQTLQKQVVHTDYLRFLRSWDPLAQTFTVSSEKYPDGVYVSSIDLCFANKDNTIPVKVELRPTLNGFPDISKIFPGGVSIVKSENVKALLDGATVQTADMVDPAKFTRFTFDYPVYLPPGEHCFVVRAESKVYSLFAAKIGEIDSRYSGVNGPIRVLDNPASGVLFRSANASTWEPDGTMDLMFGINNVVFDDNASPESPVTKQITFYANTNNAIDFNNTFETNGNYLTYETYNLPISFVDYANCRTLFTTTHYASDTLPIVTNNVPLNTNIVLGKAGKLAKTISGDKVFKITANVTLTNKYISPVFDLQSSGVILVRNMIDTSEISNGKFNLVANELLPLPDVKNGTLANTAPATQRYMTRPIALTPGFDATNIKVLLTVYKPQDTDVVVFVKVEGVTSNGQFNNKPYIQLISKGNDFTSNDINDYREMEFELPENIEPFDKFCIKICLASSNSTIIPKVKDMRGIAVQ